MKTSICCFTENTAAQSNRHQPLRNEPTQNQLCLAVISHDKMALQSHTLNFTHDTVVYQPNIAPYATNNLCLAAYLTRQDDTSIALTHTSLHDTVVSWALPAKHCALCDKHIHIHNMHMITHSQFMAHDMHCAIRHVYIDALCCMWCTHDHLPTVCHVARFRIQAWFVHYIALLSTVYTIAKVLHVDDHIYSTTHIECTCSACVVHATPIAMMCSVVLTIFSTSHVTSRHLQYMPVHIGNIAMHTNSACTCFIRKDSQTVCAHEYNSARRCLRLSLAASIHRSTSRNWKTGRLLAE